MFHARAATVFRAVSAKLGRRRGRPPIVRTYGWDEEIRPTFAPGMDFGHYNCRDYYISPHFATTTIVNDRVPLEKSRHESFDDLERRCRSPASLGPKFPLLRLPLELRQQIFNYLLPKTREHTDPNPLAHHARNFSAVKKRGERGMVIPRPGAQRGPGHVVWQRGNINLLCVCRQIHEECAKLLYGNNTFLLFLTYSGITFRFSWLLPTGAAPSRRFNLLELMPKRYLSLLKRVIVNVDHVDSYTGMVKFNVSGKGLTHGLRKQVQRLVHALGPVESSNDTEQDCFGRDAVFASARGDRRLAKVHVRVSNASAVIEQIKSDITRRSEGVKVSKDIEEMLEPFGALRGVRDVVISGAVTDIYASSLEVTMKGTEANEVLSPVLHEWRDFTDLSSPQLCVYGNDL